LATPLAREVKFALNTRTGKSLASRTFAFFCGLKIFERFFSEAPDEKGEFGVCDNLPRRQHEVMAEKMRGCF
jgi:hypothetical protein